MSGTPVANSIIPSRHATGVVEPNATAGYPQTSRESASKPPKRAPSKCDFCRRSKKKCLPLERTWPAKCERCIALELRCSAPHKSKLGRKSRGDRMEEPSIPIFPTLTDDESYQQLSAVSRPSVKALRPEYEYKAIIESLSFERMDARLRNISQPIPHTADWVLSHPNFVEWADGDSDEDHHGFLWLKGKPGSGKSTLMKYTCEQVRRKCSGSIAVPYFFNGRALGELERSSLGFYRSVLYHLLLLVPDSQKLFMDFFGTKEHMGRIWTNIELENLLIDFVDSRCSHSPIFIFIDALDEGDEDDVRAMVSFLEIMTYHSMAAGTSVRTCLASRHYPHITTRKGLSINIENEVNHARDISQFVQHELAGFSLPSAEDLKRNVCLRSNGVFLWVVLVTNMLRKLYDQGRSSSEMIASLDKAPSAMHDLYKSMAFPDIECIDESYHLFQWALYAFRPLRPIELYAAIMTHKPDYELPHFLPDGDTTTRYLLHRSRGLLQPSTTRPTTVQFIHETVREFLMDYKPEKLRPNRANPPDPMPFLAFNAVSCHTGIAETCLRYLLGLQQESLLSVGDQRYPLAAYAAEHWWSHTQRCGDLHGCRLLSLAYKLLTDKASLLSWVRLYDVDSQGSNPSIRLHELASPLYYAIWTGSLSIVATIAESCSSLNVIGGKYCSPVQLAVTLGYDMILEYLLDHGGDVNVMGYSALYAASLSENYKLIQLLLDKGADVNDGGGEADTVLYTASLNGSAKIVQLLLDRGADIEARGVGADTALHAASLNGHAKVVQLLLDRGANIDARGDKANTALYMASMNGHAKIVQLLLDCGANINYRGTAADTALHAASLNGHADVVQLLLDRGADIDARGFKADTALHAASLNGHADVVQILLDHGADPMTGRHFP